MNFSTSIKGFQFLFFSLLITLQSCNPDQTVKTYASYDLAKKDNLFEKGWIPAALEYPSMTSIYVKTDLDHNTCVFYYKVSEKDLKALKYKLKPLPKNKTDLMKSDLSAYSNKNNLNFYFFTNDRIKDTVFMAINEDEHLIYGVRR
jgi:hypothetical protein